MRSSLAYFSNINSGRNFRFKLISLFVYVVPEVVVESEIIQSQRLIYIHGNNTMAFYFRGVKYGKQDIHTFIVDYTLFGTNIEMA